MNEREALIAAADLITKPGAWCQLTNAKDKAGNCVHVHNPDAVSFCASGALLKVSGHYSCRAEQRFRRVFDMHTITFNDKKGRTQAEVVAAMRRAARPFPLNHLPF